MMGARLRDLPRTERSRVVCERVAGRIREVSPAGLGRWGPTFEIVRDPSEGFLAALEGWLDDDTDQTRQDLQRAADALVRAWREAGRRFRERDRPRKRETEGVT